MKLASLFYKALLLITVFLTGCTYGPVQEQSRIINGWISTDSGSLYVAVRKSSSREPTGISTFPDGGKRRLISQDLHIFRSDLRTRSTTLVKVLATPDTVWESFEPRIWSVTQDGVYVLLTGCHKGGECYGPLVRREIYLVDVQGRLLKIDSVTEPPRNKQPDDITVSVYPDRIEIWSRLQDKLRYRFTFDAQEGTLRESGV